MRKVSFILAASLLLTPFLALAGRSTANAASNGQLMFILDASSSMLAKDGGSATRIDKAKSALTKALDSIPAESEVGLRVYGATVPDTDKANGCQDTQVLAKPAANNAAKLKSAAAGIQAKGWTLMGKALQEVQNDFSGEGPKTVILLSDGLDTCETPNACDVAKSLTAGGVQVKINTLGLLVNDKAKSQLSCIADGSGGTYYDVNNIDSLASTLESLTKKEVDLFNTEGTPIDGTLRMDQAPLMQADKLYKDEFTIPQEVYYAVKVKAGQKITVTVKGVDATNKFGQTVYLKVFGFNKATEAKLLYEIGDSENWKGRVATVAYEIDVDKSELEDGDTAAVRVSVDGYKLDGINVPIEIKYSVKGVADDKSGAANSTGVKDDTKSSSTSGLSPIAIVLLTLGVVLLVGLLILLIKKRLAKKNPPTNGDGSNTPGTVTPNPPQTPDQPQPPANPLQQ